MKLGSLRSLVIASLGLGLSFSPTPSFADEDDLDMGLDLVPIAPAATETEAEQPDEVPDIEPAPEAEEGPPAGEVRIEQPVPQRTQPQPTPTTQPAPTFRDLDARVRFTAEPGLGAPSEGRARVGLFGVDLDVRPGEEWWHFGAGGFGAATGNMGGFFGGGLQGGVRLGVIGRVGFEAGAMLGAGGGSGADVGSGVFLRPRAGLHLDLRGFGGHADGVSLGGSLLYFPGGDFLSTHLSLSFELAAATPSTHGLAGSLVPRLSESGHGASMRSFRLTGHGYFLLPERSIAASGESLSSPRTMVGLEYREFFTPHAYGLIEPRALAAGGTAGFAELTVGAGFIVPIDRAEMFNFFGSGGVGVAGGGGVRTGGGIYLRGAMGLDIDLPGPLSVGLDVGIQDAPRRGSFTAISTGLRVGLAQEVVRPRAFAVRALDESDEIVAAGWRIRPSHVTLFGLSENGEDRVAQLAALQIDHILNDYLYVGLAGAFSYAGLERAALSTGTIGIGGTSPEWNRIRGVGELRLGAVGGGGVGGGSGLIIQPLLGVGVAITEAIGIDLMGGYTLSPSGELRSPTASVSLNYSFSTPRLRKD